MERPEAVQRPILPALRRRPRRHGGPPGRRAPRHRGRRWLTIGVVGAAFTAVLLVAQATTTVYAIDVFGALREPGEPAFIVGHRGDRASAPENTMASLERAMDELAFVETDVQLTSDGVPVLFHDVTLERIIGDAHRIDELSLAQLRMLDFGIGYGPEFTGERIPTLDEFFAALADRDGARAIVELKAAWTPDAARGAIELARRHGVHGRVVFMSFSLETLASIQRVSPTTPRIMLVRELSSDPVPVARQFGVIGVATTFASVTAAPEGLAAAHAEGLAVLCYTLNSHERWQEVSALGVDGIITDTPSELDAWLAETAPGT